MPAYPSTIWIEPTSRCNTRCRTCPHFHSDYGEDMAADVFSRIKSQVLGRVSRVNLVGGGEPLAAAHFDDLLETCRQAGVRIFFISNGLALTPERIEKCVLAEAELMLSLDGVSPETYNFIRPFIPLKRLFRAFAEIAEMRSRHPEKAFKLFTNTVVMGRNLSQLPEIVEFCLEHGVDSISLSDFAPGSVEAKDPEFAAEVPGKYPLELGAAFAKARSLAEASKTRLTHPAYYLGLSGENARQAPAREEPETAAPDYVFSQRCLLPWTHSNFLQDGKVLTCCVGNLELGNLLQDDFSAIWNGPRYERIRQLIHTNNPPAQCKYCNTLAGINAGDPGYFKKFLSENHIRNIELDSSDLELSGPLSLESGQACLEPGAKLSIFCPDAAFAALHILPDHGTCLGRFSLSGGRLVPFDTSDSTLLFEIKESDQGRLEMSLDYLNNLTSGADAKLVVKSASLLSAKFLGAKARQARRSAILDGHGEFLQQLELAFARVQASRPWQRINFGVYGLIDLGELLVERLRGPQAKFRGYFDHFAGHVRERVIFPLSKLGEHKVEVLIAAWPYQPGRTRKLLEPLCAAQNIELICLD